VDLYSHTHKFFKPDKRTDDYARQVEVGERRIRTAADMDELDQKVYGGKRVSREDIRAAAKVVADEDDDSDEEVESFYDEEEVEDENDDEEMEEKSMDEDEVDS